MKPKATHTDFRKGTRVFVRLRRGDTFVDKFVESKSGRMMFSKHGWVTTAKIKSVSIYR